MKPLPAAPLTPEDEEIFVSLCQARGLRWGMWLDQRAADSDRRDAGIMLECRKRGAVVLFFEGTVLDWRFREVEWMPLYEL
jgi:hypothetical protein